jgi:hypothetical protein
VRLTRDASNFTATIEFDPLPDTVGIVSISPLSKTPTIPTVLQAALTDFMVILAGSPPVPAMQFSVGGLPSRRAYLRFDIPSHLLDSSTVVRASLELTQVPSPSARRGDTLTIAPFMVGASSRITDLSRAAQILEVTVDYFRGSVYSLPPSGSGVRDLEMVNVLRRWSVSKAADLPRAIVLRSVLEGVDPGELRFYSREAPAALRPKLRITYVPGVEFGLP